MESKDVRTDILSVTLESLIDRNSVGDVLDTIAEVLRDKAEHIRHAWQDGVSGRAFDRAAGKVDRCAASVRKGEGI